MSQTSNMGARAEWLLPNGNAPDIVARYYLRSDTPTGRSTETPPPEAVEAFRNLIRAGGLVPANDVAAALVQSEGGIQNGDPSPFGVPWIDGLPGGMDAGQWNALTNRAAQQSAQRIAEAEASGYFNNMPTLQRQNLEAQWRSQDLQDQTARMLAESEITRRQRELDRLELERQDAVRAGDLNRAQELTIHQNQLAQEYTSLGNNLAQWLTEQTGQVFMPGQGTTNGQATPTQTGMTTLAQQQQAFEQAAAQAEMAANPRTGLQAWMMGQRSGLNGQAPVNQLNPTTPGQFTMPQGAFGQAQSATAAANGLTGAFQVPTTAFQQALLTGQAVPNQGEANVQGAWWDASQLQRSVNPGQWRTQDFMRGTADEQAGALGLASFGGFSDKTTEDLLRRNLPRFTAPTSSSVR